MNTLIEEIQLLPNLNIPDLIGNTDITIRIHTVTKTDVPTVVDDSDPTDGQLPQIPSKKDGSHKSNVSYVLPNEDELSAEEELLLEEVRRDYADIMPLHICNGSELTVNQKRDAIKFMLTFKEDYHEVTQGNYYEEENHHYNSID